MNSNRSPINSSDLIEEVKSRRFLYDSKHTNATAEVKKNAWEEIGEALFKERWYNFNANEKEAIVRELQVKWKSLRDNFSRSLKHKEMEERNGVPQAKRKKYLYYDALTFLLPYCNKKNFSNVVYVEEAKDSNDDSLDDVKPLQSLDPIQTNHVPPMQFFQIQPANSVSTHDTDLDDGLGSNNRTLNKILDDLVRMQKEEQSDDSLGNKKFLLSLLPFMKKLPDDVNLEVRLQLLSVLQTYSTGKSLF